MARRRKNRKGEVFHFLHTAWDVDLADEILLDAPREPEMVNVAEPQKMVNAPGEKGIIIFGIRTSDKKAREADVSYPIYIAEWKPGRGKESAFLVIDGWHRVAKSKQLGLKELPAFVFTLKESRKIQIR